MRFQFLQQALVAIPETDLLYSWRQYEAVFAELFGDRAKFVPTKCDMLDPYKYHLAIGNEEGPDILTERVTDALLGYSVPISFGCSNLADYFPADSYIDVDIKQPDKAIEQIEQIIYDEDDYARRLPAIIEARRRVIYEYNMIAMIAHLIDQHAPENSGEPGKLIPRRVSRLIHLKDLLGFAAFRLRNFLKT